MMFQGLEHTRMDVSGHAHIVEVMMYEHIATELQSANLVVASTLTGDKGVTGTVLLILFHKQ